MELAGRRVLVMGLGRSGQGAARLARASGAEVTGIDLRADVPPIPGVAMELGPHRDEVFEWAELVVVSPGIPPRQRQLQAVQSRGTPVVGELGFAASFLDAPMVAVTGTNGKSTVSWFTHQLLEACGWRSFVGGNLGNPLSNAVLGDAAPECLVVEVSSYQLELPGALRPDVGVVLNLSPDHLARHGTMERYAAAKARLFERMGPDQWAILPSGDARLEAAAATHGGRRGWLGDRPGVVRSGHDVWVQLGPVEARLSLEGFAVPGAHNADNAACAAMCALGVGADPVRVGAALPALRPLAHRMEVVAERGDVRWINDSKATNIDAARTGIEGLDGSAVVLLGGQGKEQHDGTLGMGSLARSLARHRAVVSFGEAGPRIAQELAAVHVPVMQATDLEDAVQRARHLARPGDAVLLSPGCASFDEFDDFEHRGRVFSALAQEGSP